MAKVNKFIYWIPRVLGILFVLFLTVFSWDVFDGNYGFWGTILALFIHNIPALILLIILIISWKREIVGGVAFIIAGLLYIALQLMRILVEPPFQWDMLFWSLPIAAPAFLVGILFWIGWRQKKATRKSKK
jgi:hypothetical protein